MGVREIYERSVRAKLLIIGSFSIFLFFSIFVAICLGSVDISLPTVVRILFGIGDKSVESVILWKLRIPRVLIAAVVGASLAVAGCIVQSVFRNSLASPYVLGISSGAAFGASLAVVLDIWTVIPIPVSAFVFSLISLAIVVGVSGRNMESSVGLLLAGIAVASLFSALTSLMIYLAGRKLELIVFWLMGGLSGLSWREFNIIFFSCTPLIIASFLLARDLNALLLGDDVAKSLGVDAEKTRLLAVVVTSLLVAVSVSYTGPIGFVGLVVPHMVRLIIGADNRFLIPASAVFGGAFLVLADLAARTVIRPAELPIGIVTSLIGVPFFIYLLRKRLRGDYLAA